MGPVQDPNAPTAWMVYIGTRDAEATAKKVEAAGGQVIAPAFDALKSGRMAVYQGPSGAFISVWEPKEMQGADIMNASNSFAWAELNARGIDKAKSFYKNVFGWGEKLMPMGEGQEGEYTEFKLNDESIAGGMEMNPMVPKEVPSYWQGYFGVGDVDKAHKKGGDLGATSMPEPQGFPGGRFAIPSDPQGAAFGRLRMGR